MTSRVPPAGLRLLAEEMFFVIPPPPKANRIVTDHFVMHVPESRPVAFTGAGLIRAGDRDPARTVEEVRQRLADYERGWATWWVSESTEPAGFAEHLRARGAVPLDDPSAEPIYTAMVLLAEPLPAPPNVIARQVADEDEYALSSEIYWEVTETPPETRDQYRARLAEGYRARHLSGDSTAYLAWLDGEPAGMASMSVRPEGAALNGGFTLPEFRGRGVYRALVRARWEDARRAGSKGLAVQAGTMARPILKRTGFESIGEIQVLYDPFAL